MDKSESLARVERITRAILSSEDGGVPLSRFEGDYRRMTKTQFPWREYDFKSARDMLISMEKAVEFKFNDEEGQFYLLPVHVTITSNGTFEDASVRAKHINNGSSRIQHSSSNSYSASTDSTTDSEMPSLVETALDPMDDMFTVDHYGRVSVFVSQSKEKPAVNYWNKENLTKLFSPFGDIVSVLVMPNKKSGFVRYWTIKEAKRAVKSLHNTLISADGNRLIVRPGVSRQQKIGQPIMSRQNDMLNKKQPPITKSVTTKMVAKVTDEALHDTTDDEDDVWDDGLLPKNISCNGGHDNKGVKNGMEALDVYGDSVTLLEMYVTEVISPGLLWLRDANMGGRDLQYISLAIEMQQESLKKLDTWKLPKEGAAYCINVREVNKDDKSGIKWSRVIVNKVFQSSEQVEVRYVDTGVMGTLSMTHLYVLPSLCQLRELPPHVMPCHLWGVASNHDNREWWPLDCQLLWSLIRNKKVFAKIRSDIFAKLKNNAFANIKNSAIRNVEQCVPVELFFDADGKDDIRDHLINKGHFVVLTDTDANRSQDANRCEDDNSLPDSDDNLSTPSQEETTTMWRPSPRKANTDPLPKQPHSIIQSHNQSLPVTSPMMWKPTKLTPNNLSFSD